MPPSDLMTDEEQAQFAAFLRARLPIPEGHRERPLYQFTQYAARVLKRPRLLHWRGLTRTEAQLVMREVARAYLSPRT